MLPRDCCVFGHISTRAHLHITHFGHSWKALQRLMTSCLLNVKPPWTNKINTKMTGLWNVESTIEQMPLQCWIYNSFNLTANISNVYIKLIIWGRFHHILSPKHIQSNKVQSWNGVFSFVTCRCDQHTIRCVRIYMQVSITIFTKYQETPPSIYLLSSSK